MDSFVKQVGVLEPRCGSSANDTLFSQYERAVVQSLITSFGLDLFIKDQHGGDVDTIHNVRQIGRDPLMRYKDKANEFGYENRMQYNEYVKAAVGGGSSDYRGRAGTWSVDEYTGKPLTLKDNPQVDHVISTKEMWDDRAYALTQLRGLDTRDSKGFDEWAYKDPEKAKFRSELSESPENMAWTNGPLNQSMGKMPIREYVARHPDLPEETRRRMLEKDAAAHRAYDKKLERNYYSSDYFIREAGGAALKRGAQMGARQAIGLVLAEIWYAVRDEFRSGAGGMASKFSKIANGIRKGLSNAKARWRELWDKFIEGSVAGFLSSVTTTLCNVFFSTAKNTIRIIRQSWASITEAAKILIINPDGLLFGERFRAAAKILATGASVVAGYMVAEAVGKYVSFIPVLGDVIQTALGAIVSAILSCSFLYAIDHNRFFNKVVELLNSVPTLEKFVAQLKQEGRYFEEYAAKLMQIDVAAYKRELDCFRGLSDQLSRATSQQEVNAVLRAAYARNGWSLPFGGHSSLDEAMRDPNFELHFR